MVYLLKDLIAHAKKMPDGSYAYPHLLTQHLEDTAKLTIEKGSVFINDNLLSVLGYAHDIGKASNAFQERIRIKSGFEAQEAHLEGKSAHHVDHSTAGAQFLYQKYGLLGVLPAYIIAGHHAGLPNGKSAEESSLSHRLQKKIENYQTILPWLNVRLPDKLNTNDFLPKEASRDKLTPFQFQFLIRMLFSALTDADFIDTENYMNQINKDLRDIRIDIKQLDVCLESHIRLLSEKSNTFINKKRNEILLDCIKAAKNDRGIFSLSVPTGGGKTISSMVFAVKHALVHNLRRIIYVIPYTSIITQNSEVFRKIFSPLGEDVVLEHHSNIDPKIETTYNRLASENWDARIIITTNVQFFESFYGNRSKTSRKLHNIARSVIIFDEAQMFPPEYLKPVLQVLTELKENYGCSMVLCTATQPALKKSEQLQEGLTDVTEIIENPEELHKELKRVTIESIPGITPNDEIAKHIASHEQVLCIVNTRKSARELFQKIVGVKPKNSCFHLSTMMCAQHRQDVLQKIKDLLDKDQACTVVSTQLIEAGVDIDFPVVFRSIAGLDSIAQAAGRCNREGKQKYGRVIIFQSEQKAPPGHLRKSAESGSISLKQFPKDPLSPEAIETYFQDLFGKSDLDEHGILRLCQARLDEIPFKDISDNFNFICQSGYQIIVPYNEGEELIDTLRSCYNGIVPKELRRKLQRYTVNIFKQPFIALSAVIEDVFGDGQFYILLNKDIYDEQIGLNPKIPEFMKTESLII